jgi:hypothetical protein
MLNAHGRRGCLVNMLQKFCSEIIDRVGGKRTNVDILSRNLVGMPKEDEDFEAEILDMKVMTFFIIRKEEEWRGMRCVNLTLDNCSKLIWGKSSNFVIKKRLNYNNKACWYPSLKRKNYWCRTYMLNLAI